VQELIINRGIPASGKTTFAKAWLAEGGSRIRVSRDDIRMQLFNKPTDVDEDLVTKVEDSTIHSALIAGYSVIVDDTNIQPAYVNRIARIGYRHPQVEVSIKFHPVELEEAQRRNRLRMVDDPQKFVPTQAIRDMHRWVIQYGEVTLPPREVWEPYVKPKVVDVSGFLASPRAILVDIDGTLAIRDPSKRGPFDWELVGLDSVNLDVARMVASYYGLHGKVILMSGRSEVCRAQTERWLEISGIPYDRMYMRKEGDYRRDAQVKYELFDKHIRNNYRVDYVLDDRQQVVDMWRSIGLTCLQVDYGDF
jgi:predicted kinase